MVLYLYALKENLDLEDVLLPTYKASKENGNFVGRCQTAAKLLQSELRTKKEWR